MKKPMGLFAALLLFLALAPLAPAGSSSPLCGDVRQALDEARDWFSENERELSDSARHAWAKHVEELEAMSRDCRPDGFVVIVPSPRDDRCAHIRAELSRAEGYFVKNERGLSDTARHAHAQRVGQLRRELSDCSARSAPPPMPQGGRCDRLVRSVEDARRLRDQAENPSMGEALDRQVQFLEKALSICNGN